MALAWGRGRFSPLSLFVIVVLAASVTACGGGTTPATPGQQAVASARTYPSPIPSGQQVSIVFESYNLATAGLGKDGTEQLIREFNALHPNIRVEGRGPASTDILAKVQAEVVAGNPPDVAQLVFSDLDFIINDLQAKAIEDLVPPAEFREYLGGEHPLHPRGAKLAAVDGKTYGTPYTFSTPTLFYNADIFRAAGLAPDKPPTTWAEAKQYALQIKEKTGKAGLNISCLGTYDWCYQGLVRSNGGRVLSEDRSKAQFADPAAVEVVTTWQDLVQSGAHPPLSAADAQAAFQGGNLGMMLNSSALQSSFIAASKGKWELRSAKMPGFAGKPAVPTNSGSALYILANDPLKQRAAWEFMKFVSSERGYTIITSKIGYLPLRPTIVNDERYLKGWAAENPLVQPNLQQLDALEPWVAFPGPNYARARDIMMKAVEEVVYTNADPAATLKAAQDRVDPLLPKR